MALSRPEPAHAGHSPSLYSVEPRSRSTALGWADALTSRVRWASSRSLAYTGHSVDLLPSAPVSRFDVKYPCSNLYPGRRHVQTRMHACPTAFL